MFTIHMESVISSNLKAVGYDPLHSLLRIEFNNGSIYDYFGVPQSIYQGLKNAPSKGSFHHTFIRNGGFSYQRIA